MMNLTSSVIRGSSSLVSVLEPVFSPVSYAMDRLFSQEKGFSMRILDARVDVFDQRIQDLTQKIVGLQADLSQYVRDTEETSQLLKDISSYAGKILELEANKTFFIQEKESLDREVATLQLALHKKGLFGLSSRDKDVKTKQKQEKEQAAQVVVKKIDDVNAQLADLEKLKSEAVRLVRSKPVASDQMSIKKKDLVQLEKERSDLQKMHWSDSTLRFNVDQDSREQRVTAMNRAFSSVLIGAIGYVALKTFVRAVQQRYSGEDLA